VVIVSAPETAPDLPRPPVRIQAVGTAIHGRPSWDQWDDLTTMALPGRRCRPVGAHRPHPADVDVVCAYDGFSIITLMWLEALGFCGRGEGGPFVEGGDPHPLGGDGFVLNPHGGQLSAGRLHGYGFLHEACVQLWGEAGDRQVARSPEVAVAAAGGGPLAGCLLLTAPR
jgi:acetyl-CoA acetyltransferase